MYQKLLHRLNEFVLLNPQQQRSLLDVVKPVFLSKDDVLLEQGEVASDIYFVNKGILRAACEVESKEVTRWFCFEEHFAAAYFSFAYRQPSEDRITAVTDSEIFSISYSALEALTTKDSVWIDLNRHLVEHYYTVLLDRVMSFQTCSTAERYSALLAERPNIEDQVPLGYLASYLGMSQETLSRLRKKRNKRKN